MPSSPSFVSATAIYGTSPAGSSTSAASVSRNSAPRAPSTTRWSNETVSVSIGRTTGCAVHGDDPVDDAADGEDRRLRRVDDRLERVDAVHAEVRDRERAALRRLRGGAALPARLDDLAAPRGDRREREGSASWTTGTTSASSVATAIADVDSRPGTTRRRARCVHARMRAQRLGADLDEQVGVRHASRPGRARTAARQLSSLDASTSRARKKCGTSCHDCVVRSAITRQTEPTWNASPFVSGDGGAACGDRLDVLRRDRAVRPTARERVEVDAARLCEPTRFRRREPAARRSPARSASPPAGRPPSVDSSDGRGRGRSGGVC